MILSRRRMIVVSCALVVAAGSGGSGLYLNNASAISDIAHSVSAAQASQTSTVQDVVAEALYQHYAMGTPSALQRARQPHTYVVARQPALPAKSSKAATEQPDQAEVTEQSRLGETALKTVFAHASPALTGRVRLALTNALAANSDPNGRFLGAGVSDLSFQDVTISADTAIVHATASAWSSIQQIGPDGSWMSATPTGTHLVTGTVRKSSDGQWAIYDLVSTHTAGSRP